MYQESRIIQVCVALSILLLPVAHLKLVFFHIPVYMIEIPVIITLCTFLLGIKKKIFKVSFHSLVSSAFAFGISLFFLGIITSFLMNEMSLRGLNMIKTWFVMPILLLSIWLQTHPQKRDIDILLLLWFGITAIVSFLSNIYIFQGILTFDGRLSSWYTSPNYLAFFLAPGILLTQYFFTHSLFKGKKWSKLMIFWMFISLLFSLFFTKSYSTWIAVFLSSSIFLTLKYPVLQKKKIIISLLILSCIAFLFLFFELRTEKWQMMISLDSRSSIASRLMIWESSIQMIAHYPLFGIGIGRFEEAYLAYQIFFPPYLEWAVPQPHNLYLAIFLQAGIVGLSGFVLLLFSWLKNMFIFFRSEMRTSHTITRPLLLISLLCIFLLIGIVDTPFFKTDVVFCFWYILFFGIALINTKKE